MDHEADLKHFARTIALGDEAVQDGNHPFGAVLGSASGAVLIEGKNSHAVDRGPGHAQANPARKAARAVKVCGPFPALKDQIAARHKAFKQTGSAP